MVGADAEADRRGGPSPATTRFVRSAPYVGVLLRGDRFARTCVPRIGDTWASGCHSLDRRATHTHCVTHESPGRSVTSSFHVGAKGRVVLPAAIRRAAHIGEGDELVARLVGEGQLLLETKDAVRARVWGAAPQPIGLDAAADVRAMRTQDVALESRNEARREAAEGSATESDEAGAALLAHLRL